MLDYIRYKARHNFLLDRKIREIRAFHEMDVKELREYENKRFLKIFNHACQHSPFYKKHYGEYGVNIKSVQSMDDIGLLPEVDKNMVRRFKKDILTGPAFYMLKGCTSGTCGTSLTVYRSFESIITENAYRWHFRNMHHVYQGDKMVMIRGDLNRDQLFRFDKHSNILYLSSYNINKDNIYKYIKLLLDFNPKFISGYPSSLEMLSNELCRININLNIPVAITSSETLYSFQREKIKNFLGADVYDWYGNAERTVAIEQYPDGAYHFAPGYSINEVYDSHMLTTSLFNDSFPLIRYKVNDVIKLSSPDLREKSCKKVPATAKIEKIQGREDDYIHLPDGTKIGRVSKVFKGVDDVLFAQVLQDHAEYIIINIVSDNPHFDNREVLKRMHLLVGDQVAIKLHLVTEDKIIKTRAGKYRMVINSLNKNYNHDKQ